MIQKLGPQMELVEVVDSGLPETRGGIHQGIH